MKSNPAPEMWSNTPNYSTYTLVHLPEMRPQIHNECTHVRVTLCLLISVVHSIVAIAYCFSYVITFIEHQ